MAKQDPEQIVDHIIDSIQWHIKDAGYKSVTEFCEKNGIIKTTVSRAIGKSRTPRLRTLVEIANALNVTLDDLIRLDKKKR